MNSIITGHSINCYLIIADKTIVTGSSKSILLWDLSYNKCIANILINFEISCFLLIIKNNVIACGSDDNTIKIFELNSKTFSESLNGHTGAINCIMKVNSKTMASGSADYTVKFWEIFFFGLV